MKKMTTYVKPNRIVRHLHDEPKMQCTEKHNQKDCGIHLKAARDCEYTLQLLTQQSRKEL